MDSIQRPGGRSARVRRSVLDAALAVLGEDGWTSTSVERIAERADVHKTTIYRRWGSAEEVVLDALLERGSLGIPVPDTGSLEADLVEFGLAISAVISDPVGRAAAAAAIAEPESAPVRQFVDSFWSERLASVAPVVQRAVDRGELPPSTDTDRIIEQVAASVWFRVMVRRGPVTEAWLADAVSMIT
ncbi:MAG: TetR/AcrR family transcriptional regulator [Actinomycetota bacterium]